MKKVLVIGDIIVDYYTQVTSERSCQENYMAPVYDVSKPTERRWGGAANVAANIASTSSGKISVSLSGITKFYRPPDGVYMWTSNCVYGEQLEKHRYCNENDILFRLDNKKKFDQYYTKAFEQLYVKSHFLNKYDCIVLSDYDKGTLTDTVIEVVLDAGVPVIVDSKREDLGIFEGADILNINELEYSQQISFRRMKSPVEDLFKKVVVTRGENGCKLLEHEKLGYSYALYSEDFPTEKIKAADVTGCGDVHTAAFVVEYIRSGDARAAARFANICATQSAKNFGTVRVSWDSLKT